jgi:hypothetical protein
MLSWLPCQSLAEDYIVLGRVYSATTLPPDEEPPINPLTDAAPQQIIGEHLLAQVPRNLVKVKVLAASDGNELGSYITRYDGGYFVSFTAAPTSDSNIDVRFVVEELATSKALLRSQDLALTAWNPSDETTVNVRFLLLDEDLSDIGGGGAVTDMEPEAPAIYTGIFTRVGKIEIATEVNGGTVRIIRDNGRATIPESTDPTDDVARRLHIPNYQDSPFGGNLYLFGAFSSDLYGKEDFHYRIRIDGPSGSTYMDDELKKTKYVVNLTTGTVETESVILGPHDGGGATDCTDSGRPVCYDPTPLSSGANVFWSFPDLLALWRTGGLNGNHTLEIEAVSTDPAELDPAEFGPIEGYTRLLLNLDNIRPIARIEKLDEGETDATPRVYTPSSPDTAISGDLMEIGAPLGDFSTDYGGSASPICGILNLGEETTVDKYLAFKLTAYHQNEAMRYWQFRFRRNDGDYKIHVGKQFKILDYETMEMAMVDFESYQVSSAEVRQDGFEGRYLYLNTDYLANGTSGLASCGYRFEIRATTRTTDGYHYLRYAWDEDVHYLQR